MIDLRCGDCLELMKDIPDNAVDMVLCDLPYGITQNKWDTCIPLEPLWEEYRRITKSTGVIALFGDEPFTSSLVMSNRNMFRYKWIWDKERGSNFQNARFSPMKCAEDILIFYSRKPTFNPQFWYAKPYKTKRRVRRKEIE